MLHSDRAVKRRFSGHFPHASSSNTPCSSSNHPGPRLSTHTCYRWDAGIYGNQEHWNESHKSPHRRTKISPTLTHHDAKETRNTKERTHQMTTLQVKTEMKWTLDNYMKLICMLCDLPVIITGTFYAVSVLR